MVAEIECRLFRAARAGFDDAPDTPRHAVGADGDKVVSEVERAVCVVVGNKHDTARGGE